MRLDALGAMEQTPCQTPTWDRMAKDGAILAQHRTTGPMCSPARASILTGLQPHQAGMPGMSTVYTQAAESSDKVRWPALCREPFSQPMRKAGYETYYVGKWHVGDYNIQEWFDWAACCHAEEPDYSEWCRLQGVADGFVFHDPARGKPYKSKYPPGMSLYRPGVLDIPEDKEHNWWVLGHAMEFLGRLRKDKPFLFGLSFEGPHPPVVVPRKYYDIYDPADVKKPDNWDAGVREPSFLEQSYFRKIRSEWSDNFDDWRKPIAVWWGYVTYIDKLFGIFLSRLEELGFMENTVVVMLADHGDMFGQHKLSQIFAPYEEVLRVPCVIRAPGQVKAGTFCKMDTSHVDIAPTILATAGIESPSGTQGENLLPYLSHIKAQPESRDTFCQYNMTSYIEGYHGVHNWRSMLRRPWKYIYHQDYGAELYNIMNDTGEINNLADMGEVRDVQEELRTALWEQMTRTNDPFLSSVDDGGNETNGG